jgi:ketopantoate reductase
MRLCIFGAGAIGSYLPGELALAGHEVCAIARGAHLAAIRNHGLKLIVEGQTRTVHLPASDDPTEFGPQDVVICALKAQQAHACAGAFAPLLGPKTAVVTAMNGIPWWYFYKEGGVFDGRHLESVDPGAAQWTEIGPERAIGCVVDPACEVVAPGVIEHHLYKRFTIGEPDGTRSDRVRALRDALVSAGFDAPIRDAIRWNVWLKLWGNVCFNPISALTLAPLDRNHRTEPAGVVQDNDGGSPVGCHSARCVDSGRNDGSPLKGRWIGHRPQDVDVAGPGAQSLVGDRRADHCRTRARPISRCSNTNDRCRADACSGERSTGWPLRKRRRSLVEVVSFLGTMFGGIRRNVAYWPTGRIRSSSVLWVRTLAIGSGLQAISIDLTRPRARTRAHC